MTANSETNAQLKLSQGDVYNDKMDAKKDNPPKAVVVPKILFLKNDARIAQRAVVAKKVNDAAFRASVPSLTSDAAQALNKEVKHLYTLLQDLAIATDSVHSHGTREDLKRGFLVVNGIRLDLTALVLAVGFTKAHRVVTCNSTLKNDITVKTTRNGQILRVPPPYTAFVPVPYVSGVDINLKAPVAPDYVQEYYGEAWTTFDYMVFLTTVIMLMKSEWKFLWPVGQHLWPYIQKLLP